jgi:methionine synthase I (cobalamin-dependent)
MELHRIGGAAVDLARKAAAKFVLADIGPIMSGTAEFECPEDLLQTIDAIPGVDGILIETCSSANVLLLIEKLRHRIHSVVLVSLAFRHSAKGICSYDGHSPEWFAERAREAGVDVLGANCGLKISLADCNEIIARFRTKCDLPLLVRPNAGTCRESKTGFEYPISPSEFAAFARGLIGSGTAMVGGCCGTTPKHIAAVRSEISRLN